MRAGNSRSGFASPETSLNFRFEWAELAFLRNVERHIGGVRRRSGEDHWLTTFRKGTTKLVLMPHIRAGTVTTTEKTTIAVANRTVG